jgi:hypothetical protein
MYLASTSSITISGCLFESNTANSEKETPYGGAIYFMCPDYEEGDDGFTCDVSIVNSIFNDNWSYNSGGAIYWDDIEPTIDDLTTFQDNYVFFYLTN